MLSFWVVLGNGNAIAFPFPISLKWKHPRAPYVIHFPPGGGRGGKVKDVNIKQMFFFLFFFSASWDIPLRMRRACTSLLPWQRKVTHETGWQWGRVAGKNHVSDFPDLPAASANAQLGAVTGLPSAIREGAELGCLNPRSFVLHDHHFVSSEPQM